MTQQERERDTMAASAPAMASTPGTHNDSEQWYTVTQAAKRIGVSAYKFRDMVRDDPELQAASIPNRADKRSRLYPRRLIDQIAGESVPQSGYHVKSE